MKKYAAIYVLLISSALGFYLASVDQETTPAQEFTQPAAETQAETQSEPATAEAESTNNPIPWGHVWRYNDSGSDLGTAWREPAYDDSTWASGPGQLGYGDGDESTVMASSKITYYLRTDINIDNAVRLSSISLDLLYDDGAIIYVNGTSVYRTSLIPPGEVPHNQVLSSASQENSRANNIDIPTQHFVTGTNVIAVELRNHNTSSSDISFDMSLSINTVDPNVPVFSSQPFSAADARATVAYTDSIADSASDANGDTIVYSKVSGPTWLTIAANGDLSGTPDYGDTGLNEFIVQASDNKDGSSTATLQIQVNDENGNTPISPNPSNTDQLRLVWLNDPSTTMTIAWTQSSGDAATVHYGETDCGRYHQLYSNTQSAGTPRTYNRSGTIVTQFAGLTGLKPDTAYYFVLADAAGVSERYWFRTAPATPKPFSFIAGGDSRNNRTPRQRANRLVGKIRPLFVSFTGDMINSDNATEWNQWLDDWESTTSSDGRMYPILPHRGNHESGGNSTLVNLFNAPSGNYYALNFGGNLLRYYVLNSESNETTQTTWLQNDLTEAGGKDAYTHLMAGYHKPMRPHQSGKSEGSTEYSAWANLFYNNRFDLIIESDTHMMKRTKPIRPDSSGDEGFIEDTTNGTVYIGEGCWGAPLRAADDGKTWTAAMASFNGFDLIHVFSDYVEVFTVQVDNEASVSSLAENSGMILPEQVSLWQPTSGTRLVVNRGATPKTSYAQFQLDGFGSSSPPANSDKHADYDGDGLSNFMEFAFGLDVAAATPANPNFPNFTIESGAKRLKFKRRSNTTARFSYSLSEDLTTWNTLQQGVDYNITVTTASGIDEVEIELIGDTANKNKSFLRVEVEE